MLFIYTVKFGQILGSDRRKKKYTLKVKDLLSFEIWIFRNGHGDDRRIFVVLIWRYATPHEAVSLVKS